MHLADQVANAINSPFLDPHKSFRLITTAGRIAAWQAAGADMDLITLVVGQVMKRQQGPVTTWAYFDEPIRRALADKKAMEQFDAAPTLGPAAQRAKRNRAAEAVLAELAGLEVACGPVAD